MEQKVATFVDREHEEARRAFPHPPDIERLETIWPIGWHLSKCSLFGNSEELATWNTVDSTHNPNPQDPEGAMADIEAFNGKWIVCWSTWLPHKETGDLDNTLLHTGPSSDLYQAVAELKTKVEAFNEARK